MRGTPEGREVSHLLPRPPRFLPRDFSPGIMKMEVMPRRPSVNSWASCRRVDPVIGGCDRGRSAARLEGDGQCCRGGRSATWGRARRRQVSDCPTLDPQLNGDPA